MSSHEVWKWKNFTVELDKHFNEFMIVVREKLLRVGDERVDFEYIHPEDVTEIFDAVCRRIVAGAHCPDWRFPDYSDKHAELFY